MPRSQKEAETLLKNLLKLDPSKDELYYMIGWCTNRAHDLAGQIIFNADFPSKAAEMRNIVWRRKQLRWIEWLRLQLLDHQGKQAVMRLEKKRRH